MAPVKMFKLAATCPACGRVPAYRATEADVLAKRGMPAAMACATVQCQRRGCGTLITLRAAAWQAAVPDGTLPIAGPQPERAPAPELTRRQAEVCALAAEGLSDRRIASTLGIGLPAVRKYLGAGAKRLRECDPRLPRSSPRRTVAAWCMRQAGSVKTLDLFGQAA